MLDSTQSSDGVITKPTLVRALVRHRSTADAGLGLSDAARDL